MSLVSNQRRKDAKTQKRKDAKSQSRHVFPHVHAVNTDFLINNSIVHRHNHPLELRGRRHTVKSLTQDLQMYYNV